MLLLPSDNGSSPAGTAIHLSADSGKHFIDPGGNIAGLHGAVVELNNGSLLVGALVFDRQRLGIPDELAVARKNQRNFFDVPFSMMPQAFGRAHDGPCPYAANMACMAMSRSDDMGQSWEYGVSPFPGIHAGQRETLLRLKEVHECTHMHNSALDWLSCALT